jgi:hypothetical protein
MKTSDPKDFLFIDEVKSIDDEFGRIADMLINKVDIAINMNLFSLYDFEFYYFSENHKDGYTLVHKSPLGFLRMHDYGIDISLGFESEIKYGGILIRGAWIKEIEGTEKQLNKSEFEILLFNSLKLGNNSISFVLREPASEFKSFKTIRKNLGVQNLEMNRTIELSEAKYRYIINEKVLFSRLKGKEKILRNSTLTIEERTQLLGYIIN